MHFIIRLHDVIVQTMSITRALPFTADLKVNQDLILWSHCIDWLCLQYWTWRHQKWYRMRKIRINIFQTKLLPCNTYFVTCFTETVYACLTMPYNFIKLQTKRNNAGKSRVNDQRCAILMNPPSSMYRVRIKPRCIFVNNATKIYKHNLIQSIVFLIYQSRNISNSFGHIVWAYRCNDYEVHFVNALPFILLKEPACYVHINFVNQDITSVGKPITYQTHARHTLAGMPTTRAAFIIGKLHKLWMLLLV